MKKLLTKFIVVSIVMLVGLAMLSYTSGGPPALGVTDGRLAACPESPNCVSTQTDSQSHQMAPIPFSGSAEDALERLKKVIDQQFSRVRLIDRRDGYLRYEFRSLIFRFVDDVEFLVDPDASLIHFRSASRVGHSDLGANKSRMQKVVAALE